ncbi:MAG TPA: sensor histidine kinase [Trueperaceae bacterium]
MNQVPFFDRISTRLTLLILVVVAVLAAAATILLVRGFNLAGSGLPAVDAVPRDELNAIIRGTVINLVAVFLFTLVAATVFSRSLLIEPIMSLVKGTGELAEGNLGVTLPVTSKSELGMLAEAFNTMSLRLAERTRELTDSNEALRLSEERHLETLALLEQRVRERTAELEALLERVHEQAALEERQHLARELHDSVSQALYGILLGTNAAQRQLEGDPVAAASALSYVEGLAQAGIAEMRALIFELRPESLEQEGLSGALSKQLDALEARHDLETETRIAGEPKLPLATKQVLYRVAQEAFHNTVKHARARRVELRLAWDENRLVLEVADDGQGFDPGQEFPGHLGLRSMQERVERLGGTLEIDSRPGGGTRVTASIPMPAGANGGKQ